MQDLEMRMCDQAAWAREYMLATRAIQKWYRFRRDKRAAAGMYKLIDIIKADQDGHASDVAVTGDKKPVTSVVAEYIKI